MREWLRRIDRFQQRHTVLGFPFGVVKKFGDDRAGQMAGLVAYFGFFSLFPLLLVLVTILGFVLQGNEELQARIVDSALAQFPIIGAQLRQNVGAISGSGPALVVGVLGALWAGMGVLRFTQFAMNEVWDVPQYRRPRVWRKALRSLIILGILGAVLVVATVLGGLAGGGGPLAILSWLGSLLLNLALFLIVFRVLTVADISWRDVLPGASVAAIGYAILHAIGGYLIRRRLQGAAEVYGFFAVVIGVLFWIYLSAQLMLFAAEINVVLKRRLWPRSLAPPPFTEPDRRVVAAQARQQKRREEQTIEVTFADEGGG